MLVAILLFAATSAYQSYETSSYAAVAAQQTSLHAGLTVARVAEPAKVAKVLRELSLDSFTHWRTDLAALSSGEHAEMAAALEGGRVTLGDRSRLRMWLDPGKDHSPPETYGNDLPRRLQSESEQPAVAEENKRVSSDVIAIMLTGLTAVAGYILQVRSLASHYLFFLLPFS